MLSESTLSYGIREAIEVEALEKLSEYLQKSGINTLCNLASEFHVAKDGEKWSYLKGIVRDMGIKNETEIKRISAHMFTEISQVLLPETEIRPSDDVPEYLEGKIRRGNKEIELFNFK